MDNILKLIELERGTKIEKGTLNSFFISDRGIYGVTDVDFSIFEKVDSYKGDHEWFANKYTEVVTAFEDTATLSDISNLCSKLNERFNPKKLGGIKLFAPFRLDDNYNLEVNVDLIKKTILGMSIFSRDIEEAVYMARANLLKLGAVMSVLPVNERVHYYDCNLLEVSIDITNYNGSYDSIVVNY